MTGGSIVCTGASALNMYEESNIDISGGSIKSDKSVIQLYSPYNYTNRHTVSITGTSTVVQTTSSTWPTIYCGEDVRGTINIGTQGASSSTYPHIINPKAGNGIKLESSSNVTINKYSGKVD